MSVKDKARIFLTGVGGQGTLTATIILAKACLAKGLDVTAGEIHGMAQRGGVVESTVLIGGYASPRIAHGEADVILGFEPLETLRALPYLAKDGVVVSNSEPLLPIGVSLGRESYPDLGMIKEKTAGCAASAYFVPCAALAKEAGTVMAANMVLLGALAGLGILPMDMDCLTETLKANLKPKIVDMNLKAIGLGAQAAASGS